MTLFRLTVVSIDSLTSSVKFSVVIVGLFTQCSDRI